MNFKRKIINICVAFITLLALSFTTTATIRANGNRVYVTYYTETNGHGWPYTSVVACPYSIPKGTVIRIEGLQQGSYDQFTGQNDLFQCQDRYATYLSFRFDVWKVDDGNNITGYYNYTILGRLPIE